MGGEGRGGLGLRKSEGWGGVDGRGVDLGAAMLGGWLGW